jgi:response regulator RpfG family c-di-GMP phosphodiesterase
MSQVRPSITSKTWVEMTEPEQILYHQHVLLSEQVLKELSHNAVPSGALEIIRMHHEKFDGTGYPAHLEAFAIPDLPQVLSMSDILETISSGLWDGKQRTRKESFFLLEERDKNKTFPEYFNPDTFKRVKSFIHSKAGDAAFEEATASVTDKTQEMIEAA